MNEKSLTFNSNETKIVNYLIEALNCELSGGDGLQNLLNKIAEIYWIGGKFVRLTPAEDYTSDESYASRPSKFWEYYNRQ